MNTHYDPRDVPESAVSVTELNPGEWFVVDEDGEPLDSPHSGPWSSEGAAHNAYEVIQRDAQAYVDELHAESLYDERLQDADYEEHYERGRA